MLKEVLKQIEQRNRFVLTSHARPDGDAIGSALACGQILRAMGKEADVVLRDGVPRIYQPLPYAHEVVQAESVNGNYEAAIILECDSIQRTRLHGLENKFLINIDHHQSGRPFAQVNWIDPKAVATAEMVYRLAREAGVKDFSGDRDLPLHRRPHRYRVVHVRRHERTHLRAGAGAGAGGRGPRATAPAIFISDIPPPKCACWARRSPICTAKGRWRGFR